MHISWLSEITERVLAAPDRLSVPGQNLCLLVLKGSLLLPQGQTQYCVLASKLQFVELAFCSWKRDKNQNTRFPLHSIEASMHLNARS